MQEIASYIVFFGFFNCLLLLIAELLKGREAVWPLVILVIMLGSVQLRIGFYLNGVLFEQPYWVVLLIASIWALGPALLHFADYMLQYDYFKGSNALRHYAWSLLTVCTEVVVYLFSDRTDVVRMIDEIIVTPQFGFLTYLFILAICVPAAYLGIALYGYIKSYRSYDFAFSKFATATILTPIIAVIAALNGVIHRLPDFIAFTGIMLTVTVSYLVVFATMRSRLFTEIREDISIRRHSRSLLGNIDVGEISKKLKHLLETEKIYRNEKLTLPILAEHLGISYYSLSELINKEFGKSFTRLINDYRIGEAKEILVNEPDGQILAIAYTVGFNSKSAFNEQFKKITGMTPSQFRKSQT